MSRRTPFPLPPPTEIPHSACRSHGGHVSNISYIVRMCSCIHVLVLGLQQSQLHPWESQSWVQGRVGRGEHCYLDGGERQESRVFVVQ